MPCREALFLLETFDTSLSTARPEWDAKAFDCAPRPKSLKRGLAPV